MNNFNPYQGANIENQYSVAAAYIALAEYISDIAVFPDSSCDIPKNTPGIGRSLPVEMDKSLQQKHKFHIKSLSENTTNIVGYVLL